jgi:hypothetical protein
MTIELQARASSLDDLARLLQSQHAMKLDANVGAGAIRSEQGVIMVEGLTVLDDDLAFVPTDIAIGHLAERLGIPALYLRKLHAERTDLFDENINGWLHGHSTYAEGEGVTPVYPGDNRTHLLRTFSEPGETGILRAVLSNAYGMIDNLDVLMACLDAIKTSGAEVTVSRCDLTERRMNVRFTAPGIAVQADTLLKGYVSPYTGRTGSESKLIHAGFDLGNSETGGSSFYVEPVLIVEACTNGLTQKQDRLRKIHLGGRMEEGIVRWSDETRRLNMESVASQARDAVLTFLDADYVRMVLDRMEETAVVTLTDPVKTIELVSKHLKYSEAQQAGILDHFIKGGQVTAGGVMQAVTSWSQEIADPDVALDFEATGVEAMEYAALVA